MNASISKQNYMMLASNFSSNLLDFNSLESLQFQSSLNCTDCSWTLSDFATQLFVPVVFGVITILGLIGNGLVICIVLSDQRMRTNTFALITNLAIADLIFIITCVPFTAVIYSHPGWPFGFVWCKIYNYVINVTAYVSVYTLILMALDRFLAVVYPVRSKSIRTFRKTVTMICVMWILFGLLNIPVILQHHVELYELGEVKKTICINFYIRRDNFKMWRGKIFHGCFFLFAYFLPLVSISWLYAIMLRRLPTRSTKKTRVSSSPADIEKTSLETSRARLRLQQKPEPKLELLVKSAEQNKSAIVIVPLSTSDVHPNTSSEMLIETKSKSIAQDTQRKPECTLDTELSLLSPQFRSSPTSFINPDFISHNPETDARYPNCGVSPDVSPSVNGSRNQSLPNAADGNEDERTEAKVIPQTSMYLQIPTPSLLTPPSSSTPGTTSSNVSSSAARLSFMSAKGSVKRAKANRRVARLVIIVIAVFAVCWLPWHVISILHFWVYEGTVSSDITHLLTKLTATSFAYANSCINPILYAFLSENFRLGVRRLFNRCRRKFTN